MLTTDHVMTLLDDPDPAIYAQFSQMIKQMEPSAELLQQFEHVFETTLNDITRQHAEKLILWLREKLADKALTAWFLNADELPLEAVLIWLTQLYEPLFNTEMFRQNMNMLSLRITDDLHKIRDTVEKLSVVNHHFYAYFSLMPDGATTIDSLLIGTAFKTHQLHPATLHCIYRLVLEKSLHCTVKTPQIDPEKIVLTETSAHGRRQLWINPRNGGAITRINAGETEFPYLSKQALLYRIIEQLLIIHIARDETDMAQRLTNIVSNLIIEKL
ncbi:MAG: hypothetical protein LBR06_09950 [Bacteroidales bacterium]|jgi:hypothetical protein|nr:hypothetical protein [Bacteroidales bacterium]